MWMHLVAMLEVLQVVHRECVLGQEKAYANDKADQPIFPHLKRLELYSTEMSLMKYASKSMCPMPAHLVPRIHPSRLCSGRVLVASCCIPAGKPNRFARVEVSS